MVFGRKLELWTSLCSVQEAATDGLGAITGHWRCWATQEEKDTDLFPEELMKKGILMTPFSTGHLEDGYS